jgi:hypothetical protein
MKLKLDDAGTTKLRSARFSAINSVKNDPAIDDIASQNHPDPNTRDAAPTIPCSRRTTPKSPINVIALLINTSPIDDNTMNTTKIGQIDRGIFLTDAHPVSAHAVCRECVKAHVLRILRLR